MNGLVQQALTGETSAVCAAAQHANLLLPDTESGSLAWWLCKEVLAASKVFDHTSFLLILRGLETMRKSRPCGSGTLRVTCCNLTTWRREVKQWLVNQGEVLLVQEHHLLGPSLPEEISSMGGLGYDSLLVPACAGEGRHNSSHGGIGIFVKSHLGARFRGQFVKQGCGYVAVTLRRLGADITVVSLYLQSSSGFGSHVNSAILASLRSFRDQVNGPFLVGGELQDTSLFESLSLLPLGTGQPTCGDNELDYLGVSPCLEGLTRVATSWEVPFRPHAALQIELHSGAFQLTTPQLPVFALQFKEHPAEYCQVEEILASMPDTEVLGDPLSNRLASISRSVEDSLLEKIQGVGRSLQVTFAPAVPRMSQTSWEGSRQAFWHRFQFLCKEDKPHRLEQGCALVSQILQHWEGESETGPTFADSVDSFLRMGKKPSDELLLRIQEQVLDAAKVQKTSQNRQYQAWLQGAQGKGMGPLFKSLKKGEATTARPHRELSAEVRALARAKVWLKTWKGYLRLEDVPAPTHVEQEARAQLRELARQQAAALPPLTAFLLKTKFGKGRVTAPGPDGWSKSILKKLTDPMLEDIADLFRQIEVGLRLPQQFLLTQVCMMPKSLTSERPISLTHVLWRDYCRARWDLIRDWSEIYQCQAPWDSAVPGKTSLDVGIRRLVWAEASQTQSRHFIGMFLDIKGFYDSVVWSSVVDTRILLEFPPLVLELALQLYGGERLLSAENSVSPGIFPSVGLLQGCPVAPVVSKLALFTPLKELHAESLTHNIDQ